MLRSALLAGSLLWSCAVLAQLEQMQMLRAMVVDQAERPSAD
jgi:hypothetical protein